MPVIAGYNPRKINLGVIDSVRKRRGKVIEKLKENGIIEKNYIHNDDESSEYEESDD